MLEVQLPNITPKLLLNQKILTVGSCFSAHMQEKLSVNKFDTLAHPFGTLYHPETIAKALYPTSQSDPKADLIQSNDLWFHWDSHSLIWGNTQEEVIQRYDEAVSSFSNYIQNTSWLIITIGSAFIYKYKAVERNVANCHKVPQSHFKKELSSEASMLSSIERLINQLYSDFPSLNIILTVSPVRHYRDGLIENNVSKGRLLSVAYEIDNQYDHVTYFPAYEILIDQLRDYRYYKSDKVHPNDEAIDSIWNYLVGSWLDEESTTFVEKWSKLYQSLTHKPLYPGSKNHLSFLQNTLEAVKDLSRQRDLTDELQALSKELHKYS